MNLMNLRWSKHQATLLSVFDTLLDKDKLTDCTISAEGRQLRAHKIILSACSPYFEELFSENNEKHPIIILHDVKYDVIKALVEFMYRGEINVPQMELRGVLKLSKSLQIRGLSDSGYVDEVNMPIVSGMNSPQAAPDNYPSQPVSVPHFTSGQSEPEGKGDSGRGCSPTVSSLEGVASVAKSHQKNRKGVTDSDYDERTGQNACQEVTTLDCDSTHQLPCHREEQLTMCNLTGGPIYSPNHCQSVSNELQTTNEEMDVAENEQFIVPEVVLPDERSTNLSSLQHEVSLEMKSENLKDHFEIVESLTFDDSVNEVQKRSARNLRPSSEALPSQHVSVPSYTDGGNEPEENMQVLRQWSPTMSHQEAGHVEVEQISQSIRNYRKSFSQSGPYQESSQNAFNEIITSDIENVQPQSGGRVLPTSCNPTDGPIHTPFRQLKTSASCAESTIFSSSCSPVARQSVFKGSQSSSGEMTVAENYQLLKKLLTGRSSSNLTSQQTEVTVEKESELNKNNMEFVEDLTLDDDDDDDYCNYSSSETENRAIRAPNEGLTNEEIIYNQNSNKQCSLSASDYLIKKTSHGHRLLFKRHTCNACGKSYRYLAGLQRHWKFSCGKEPQFQCPHCSHRTNRPDHLKKHITHVHSQM